MKLAIIGSRSLVNVKLNDYIPLGITEIVSGGAKGIDTLAATYAKENGLLLTLFLPDYTHFGKGAPLKRNEQIAEYADEALIFWDGKSRGTAYTLSCFSRLNKKYTLIRIE